MEIVMVCDQEKVSVKECESWIKNHFSENYSISKVSVCNSREISVKDFIRSIKSADKMDFSNRGYLYNDLDFDYFDNSQYNVLEYIYDTKPLTKDDAFENAAMIMADQSYLDELERIYSNDNKRKFYGHPVHYKISAANVEAAKDMLKLLVRSLRSNERLLGTRANYNRCQLNTLFVFVEITEKPGFAKPMIATMQEDLHIIEIKEGRGDRKRALEYLKALTKKSMFDVNSEELEQALPMKKDYTASEIYETYNKWFSKGLKNKIYRSYRNCEKVAIDYKKTYDFPYEEFQNMVGLTEIKAIVDQIINAAKVQKARSKMGLDTYGSSRHMIFTGNPGSAKTTVARLLAQILKKEDVLESGIPAHSGMIPELFYKSILLFRGD